MKRKNILLLLMAMYCAVGITALIFTVDTGIATASLSSPKRPKPEDTLPEILEPEPETVKQTEIDEPPVYTYTAIHSTGRLFIRSGPSMEDQIISFMRPGTTGTIISIGDNWALLKYGEIEGYVFKGYLKITKAK